MKTLLLQGREGPTKAADWPSGFVDFYGYHSVAGGWLFCARILKGCGDGLCFENAVVCFGESDFAGELIGTTYLRHDVGDAWGGVIFFINCPAGSLGPLLSISFDATGRRCLLCPTATVQRLREPELVAKLLPILAGAPVSLYRDTLVTLLNRRAYKGQDTLADLRDHFAFEIDETVVCQPDGLLLMGWYLAKRDKIRNVRIRCGPLVSPLELSDCIWLERPDVLATLNGKHECDDPRCGFMAFLPHAIVPGCPIYVEVETQLGEVGVRTVPVSDFRGIAAIKRILECFDLRFMDVPKAYDRVIGPAIEMLNKSRLGVKPLVSVVDYGQLPSHPKFSVIVPVYGRLDLVEYQLGLLSAHVGNAEVEFIYVLDDPPKRREAQVLFASLYERFRIPFRGLLLDRNVGFAPTNNAGLEFANGFYVAFVNSDVFPGTPDWLERLSGRLGADPKLGAVGPLLLFEDGSVQHQGMYFEPLDEFGNWFFGQHFGKGLRYTGRPGLHGCISITGACMVMERELARKVGGFEEAYVLGDFEDSDLCLRLRTMGLNCAVDSEVQLYHLERQSQSSSALRWRMNLTLYNAWLHQRRWASTIAAYPASDEPVPITDKEAPLSIAVRSTRRRAK